MFRILKVQLQITGEPSNGSLEITEELGADSELGVWITQRLKPKKNEKPGLGKSPAKAVIDWLDKNI